jgi:hypothetical protein
MSARSQRRPVDGFRYGEVEKLLSSVLEIKEKGFKAFRASINYMRKAGTPFDLPQTGSGVKIWYTKDQIFEMAIALDMQGSGWSPQWAGAIARSLRKNFQEFRQQSADNTKQECWVIVVRDEDDRSVPRLSTFYDFGFLQLHILSESRHKATFIVANLSTLSRQLEEAIAKL